MRDALGQTVEDVNRTEHRHENEKSAMVNSMLSVGR